MSQVNNVREALTLYSMFAYCLGTHCKLAFIDAKYRFLVSVESALSLWLCCCSICAFLKGNGVKEWILGT
jgi:hypothetical protein